MGNKKKRRENVVKTLHFVQNIHNFQVILLLLPGKKQFSCVMLSFVSIDLFEWFFVPINRYGKKKQKQYQ